MAKKSILKISLWVIFAALIFIGYFFSGHQAKKYHLDYIPSNSNGIILIDVKEIGKEFYHLIKKNPSELLKLSSEYEVKSIQEPGFDPLSKIALYTEVYKGNILFGIILPEANADSFFKTFNLKNEEEYIHSMGTEKICIYKKNNAFAFIQNKVGFFVKMIHQEKPLNTAFVMNYFNFLNEDQKNLKSTNANSLKSIKKSKDHLAFWTNPSGFRLFSLNKLFKAMSTSVNFTKGKLTLKIDADLFENHSFTETNNAIKELKEFEIAKLSANVNQQLIKSLVQDYMPSIINNCLNDWNGEFYLSIIGFRNENVLLNDGTNISKEFNIPEIAAAFKLDNVANIKSAIINDSAFIKIENGYSFKLKKFNNEKCFLYFKDDHLLFSTKQIANNKYTVAFNTFHFKIDFKKLIENYPSKSISHRFILNMLQEKVQLNELNLKYNGKTDNTIHLNGNFYFGDKDQHKLVEFLEDIKNIPFKDLLSTLTSSSELIVPPNKK